MALSRYVPSSRRSQWEAWQVWHIWASSEATLFISSQLARPAARLRASTCFRAVRVHESASAVARAFQNAP
jgi:hypothetical protein